MATAKSTTTGSAMSKRRKALYICIAILALLIGAFIWNLATINGYANIGTGYASRVICSCRYVAGRSLEDCKKDFEPGMEIVSLSDDPENKRVTAYVPLMAEAAAELRGVSGCVSLTPKELDALN